MNDTTTSSLRYEKFYDGGHDNWRIVKYETTDDGATTEDHLAIVETETMADMLIAMLDCPVIAINVSGGQVRDVLCPADFVPQLRILVVDHDFDPRDSDEKTEHTLYTDAHGDPKLANVSQPTVVHLGGATDIECAVTAYLSPRRFPLGRLRATPAAIKAVEEAAESPLVFLARHARSDWGDVNEEDKELNDESVQDGSRILSAYRTSLGVKLWIITEATDDLGRRASTTIMLPEEY